MSNYSEKLDSLKTLMAREQNFSKILSYFFDELIHDSVFMRSGKPYKSPTFKVILKAIKTQMFGEEGEVTQVRLFSLAKEKFVHGTCTLNGKMGTVIYFEDINMGLLALTVSLRTGEVRYLRFSGTEMDPSKAAFFTHSGSKTIQ